MFSSKDDRVFSSRNSGVFISSAVYVDGTLGTLCATLISKNLNVALQSPPVSEALKAVQFLGVGTTLVCTCPTVTS